MKTQTFMHFAFHFAVLGGVSQMITVFGERYPAQATTLHSIANPRPTPNISSPPISSDPHLTSTHHHGYLNAILRW